MDDKRELGPPVTKLMLVFLLLGLAGLSFFFWKYDEVFPEASIDLKLSKTQIADRACRLAGEVGFATTGQVVSTTFGGDDYSKTFLEYEYEMSKANALMKSEVPVWYWTTRLCKAFEMEELKISLSPEGRLCSLNHEIEKERPLPSLSHEAARLLALKFINDKAGICLADPAEKSAGTSAKLIKDGTIKQAKRTDHYFTWEDNIHDFKGGKLRLSAYISGDRVTGFDRYLHVPDSFDRKYNQIRSYNELFKSISGVLYAVVSAAMAFVFLWALSTRRLRWRFALCAAVFSFFLQLADTWNYFPGIVAAYDTAKAFNAFLVDEVLSSLGQAFFAALGTLVVVGGIEAIYRAVYVDKIAVEKYFTLDGLRDKQIFQALFVGNAILGIHLGWVAFYYLYGRNFGLWSPLEVRDAATLSSIIPAFSSFAVGVNASVTEELMYRVLCLILVQRLCRNFWIANIIQAAGWAFMHSDYPQEPAYARGLELTVVGLFYGYVFKRFGLLPCILSHFTYDSFLGITPLLFSKSASMLASGLLACLPAPLMLIASAWLVRKGFIADRALLLNGNVGALSGEKKPELPAEKMTVVYNALGKTQKVFLILSTIIMLAAALFVPSHQFGERSRLRLGRDRAIAVAREYLAGRGINPLPWKTAAWLGDNLQEDEVQYGFEKAGFAQAERIMASARYPMIWWVRFFKPLERESYCVLINPQGRAIALDVTLDESAPGKQINSEQARKLVEDYLRRERPEFAPWEFEAVSEQKKNHRVDHVVTFDVPKFKLGDAHLKVAVDTVGNIVSFPHVSWEIPQAWLFEQEKHTVKDHIAKYATWIYLLAVMITFIVWLIGLARSQPLHWRPAIFTGLIFVVLDLVRRLNDIPGLFASYDTDNSVETFLLRSFDRAAVSTLMLGAAITLQMSISYAAARLLQPGFTISGLLRHYLHPANSEERSTQKALWQDGLLLGYTIPLAFFAFNSLVDNLGFGFSRNASCVSFESLCRLSHLASPALDFILQAFMGAIAILMMMPVLAGLHAKYLRTERRTVIFLLFSVLLLYSAEKYFQDYCLSVIAITVTCLGAYFTVTRLYRRNLVAYFVGAYVIGLAPPVLNAFFYARDVFVPDVYIGMVGLTLPIVFWLVQTVLRSKAPDEPSLLISAD